MPNLFECKNDEKEQNTKYVMSRVHSFSIGVRRLFVMGTLHRHTHPAAAESMDFEIVPHIFSMAAPLQMRSVHCGRWFWLDTLPRTMLDRFVCRHVAARPPRWLHKSMNQLLTVTFRILYYRPSPAIKQTTQKCINTYCHSINSVPCGQRDLLELPTTIKIDIPIISRFNWFYRPKTTNIPCQQFRGNASASHNRLPNMPSKSGNDASTTKVPYELTIFIRFVPVFGIGMWKLETLDLRFTTAHKSPSIESIFYDLFTLRSHAFSRNWNIKNKINKTQSPIKSNGKSRAQWI